LLGCPPHTLISHCRVRHFADHRGQGLIEGEQGQEPDYELIQQAQQGVGAHPASVGVKRSQLSEIPTECVARR
jgi:hypothetical protein